MKSKNKKDIVLFRLFPDDTNLFKMKLSISPKLWRELAVKTLKSSFMAVKKIWEFIKLVIRTIWSLGDVDNVKDTKISYVSKTKLRKWTDRCFNKNNY